MRFLFSSVMKMSKKVHTPAPYINVDDFLDVLFSIKSHSYGTFTYEQVTDIANRIGSTGTTNKLYNLKEEVKTNRRAITKYLDKDASTEHKNIIYQAWDCCFKQNMYSGGNIKEEHEDGEIIMRLFAFFIEFSKQPIYLCANSKTFFTNINEKNETATDGNKLTTVKLNTDYFINFLMKKTDENSFSLKTSHHISSGMDMDYFWTCFHNFVNDSEGSYLPYELTDGELSHLFVRIDEVSSDHINETIHYMFRLGYVLPELKKRDDGTYVYSLCYANSFHETRIPIEYENFKENYSNILNLSKIEKQKLKTLFTVKSWKGILMDIADPITNYPFSAEENTFSEKDFERVFVRMLKTRLEVHVLLDCEKLTQKQLDLMIQVKGQVKKRKNPTATVNRSFAMLDVEAKIIIDYNAGERFHAIIELKKNAGNLTSMSLMLGSDKQYEEIRGLEGEKKVYIVASLNERGIPRHRTKVNERNMAFVVTDNIRNRNPMKGNNRRTVS